MSGTYVVITTINEKTEAVCAFEELGVGKITLVGDLKSKPISSNKITKFLSVKEQEQLGFHISKKLPYNHYVRKNIGYLYALKEGGEMIYDTDDDNLPYKNWTFPTMDSYRGELIKEAKYFNVYSRFTDELIWPRGFPLNRVSKPEDWVSEEDNADIGVWQGLADLDPDVDAIHRLIYGKEIRFNERRPLVLDIGTYCPFNSQNTLWKKEMMPYAYLPSTVTFRFTDILRGYVAQRCFWEHGQRLGFTKATVFQERNEHDLMKDFESEIPCYMQIEKLVSILNTIELNTDFRHNLTSIYQALAKEGIVQLNELDIIEAWINDISKFI